MGRDPDFISRQTRESKRFYLDLNPPPDQRLSVVCGGVERMLPDYIVERSGFPYFGIELVTEGHGWLTLQGKRFRLSRGMAFAYGPGIRHRIENAPPGAMRKYYLDISGWEAKSLVAAAGLLRGKPVVTARVGELTELWDTIDREAGENTRFSPEICQLVTRTLLMKIRQRQITTGEKSIPKSFRTYEHVRAFIEKNFLDLTTIEQVAQACQVTPIYISRLFKKHASIGAYQFLIRLRMHHAAELLLHEQMKVRDVAEVMGFADPFQFSRAFKRVYGVAPSKLVSRHESSSLPETN
ncbi:AraC family transcriptional regulator [Stieleria sp.]|uniref:Virulence regulon transcriptional activator VirF n=1 Tax=Stieleria magnilauensis TaxID=2527963 RepID=A0ABX5XXS1_9BACT|nr:Virulence regulon transcriptional activator VirF [Planctomycetes bacterium TBK1r]